jgi:two-component system OmpR family response regulator
MKKILIIDDEKDFGFFVKQNLELVGGYSVIVTTGGKDGIAAALRYKPDLILLDVIMPQMSGFEVLQTLKDGTATTMIPVIMLTAVDTDEAKEKALGLYNEDYIVKPVAISELKAKIDAVLARRF